MLDLHIHSKFSDGIFDIKKIKLMAQENNFSVISITDHDNIASCKYIKENNLQDNIIFVPGIEMSTESYFFGYKLKIHLLGYGYDYNNTSLIDILKYIYFEREKVNRKYIEELIVRFDFLSEDLFKNFEYGKYGRIKKNVLAYLNLILTPEQQNILINYLDNNIPKYPIYNFKIEDAISTLLSAGGYPVIAHPFQYDIDDDSLNKLIRYLKECGLEGIETYHNDASVEQTVFYNTLANRYSLFETGGSDCHSGKLGSKHSMLSTSGKKLVKRLIKEGKVITNE